MFDYIEKKYIKYARPDIVRLSDTKFNCKCDVCGDSSKSKRKKRMFFYHEKGAKYASVHCFNCGYSSSLYRYLKEYHLHLFSQFIQERKMDSLDALKRDADYSIEVLKEEPISNDVIDICEPLQTSPDALRYLNSRKIQYRTSFDWYWCNGELTIGETSVTLDGYIIIPMKRKDGSWYGFQGRSVKDKIFYNKLFDNEETKGIGIYEADVTKPVYIFEAEFDRRSTGIANSISLLGVGSSLPEILKHSDIIYCYDNYYSDKASRETLIKKLTENPKHKMFSWGALKQFKDFNEALKSGMNQAEIANIIRENIKDGVSALVELKFIRD